MTMLKTFNLKGEKLSFADWISNLSPCETPFVSMIPKEKVDQTMYQWQTDRLTQPNKQGSNPTDPNKTVDPDSQDIAIYTDGLKEGLAFASENRFHTKVHKNYTQIFRKAVRVSDTTKKISLYGRNSELSYQLEKAGMELKRDLEYTILNSVADGRQGTAGAAGLFSGFQKLIAPIKGKCWDTGAEVHKAVTYTKVAVNGRQVYFTKEQVFDLTYNLYLAGARANKIMFHPEHMGQFSDWVGNTMPAAGSAPHLHRMFDGLDAKYNAFVKKIRDPLGQEFTLIPNRHMPKDMLFFFNEADWSQMVLREPQKVVLAKMGSSEKHMIEMEVGLRHRNPFASGILEFHESSKTHIKGLTVTPFQAVGDGTEIAHVTGTVYTAEGTPKATAAAAEDVVLTATSIGEAGGDAVTPGTFAAVGTSGEFKVPLKAGASGTGKKSGRSKITAKIAADMVSTEATATFYAD